MATYKVIQDIEAEDKLVGPLTLRQFIYAGIVAILGFICVKLAFVNIFLIIPFIPPMVFFGMLAAPLGRDQPNEVWLLAKIRFYLQPHDRVWNQSGTHELVTITIPKKTEKKLTKGFTSGEAESRLHALASTIDTRGWAVKNVNVNLYTQPSYLQDTSSDRLIDPSTMPQDVPNADITAVDDIFETNNPSAQHITEMLSANEQEQHKYHEALVQGDESVRKPKESADSPTDYWFMSQDPNQPLPEGYETFRNNSVVTPGEDQATYDKQARSENVGDIDPALLYKIETHHEEGPNLAYGHTKVVTPLSEQKHQSKPTINTPVTSQPDNAKISALARDNNRSVASLSHDVNEPPEDEVVVSLH